MVAWCYVVKSISRNVEKFVFFKCRYRYWKETCQMSLYFNIKPWWPVVSVFILARAFRCVSYVYRFFFRNHPHHKLSAKYHSKEVSIQEIIFVRDRLIVMTQKVSFSEKYQCLAAKQPIPASSSLLFLNPFLSDNYIIRSCGRLEATTGLTYDEKIPSYFHIIANIQDCLSVLFTKSSS